MGRRATALCQLASHRRVKQSTKIIPDIRLRYPEMYREMGLGEIGHLLSCQRDATFCEGYDKRLKLERTQTIMQGASYCDFKYKLVETE